MLTSPVFSPSTSFFFTGQPKGESIRTSHRWPGNNSAALTGLIFVGVSINLTKIMASPNLQNRALEALTPVFSFVIAGIILLIWGKNGLY
jgi:hypothetical protein